MSRQYHPKTRPCENCGAAFAPGHSHRKLCPACQARAERSRPFAYEKQVAAARLLLQLRRLLEVDETSAEGAAQFAAQAQTLHDLVAELWTLLPLTDEARRAALVVIDDTDAASEAAAQWTEDEIDRIAAALLADLEISFGD